VNQEVFDTEMMRTRTADFHYSQHGKSKRNIQNSVPAPQNHLAKLFTSSQSNAKQRQGTTLDRKVKKAPNFNSKEN
jgi:hypothetical protein